VEPLRVGGDLFGRERLDLGVRRRRSRPRHQAAVHLEQLRLCLGRLERLRAGGDPLRILLEVLVRLLLVDLHLDERQVELFDQLAHPAHGQAERRRQDRPADLPAAGEASERERVRVDVADHAAVQLERGHLRLPLGLVIG
jgi:hypothetical protein